MSGPANANPWLRKLVEWQTKRPFLVLALVVLVTLPAIFGATKLDLWVGFDSLLPENKPSVLESRRVAEHTAGVATLVIVIDGKNTDGITRFGDTLLPKLRALGPDWVGTAEDGVHAQLDFLKKNRALFVPQDKLKEVDDLVERRLSYEVYGSFDDKEPEPITRQSIERILTGGGSSTPAAPSGPPYPRGYYMNLEGTRLVTVVRTPVAAGDLVRSAELRKKVEGVVAEVNPKSFDPAIEVSYGGDIVTASEQYGTVKNDMVSVGILGIVMILLVDWLFFLRVRAVFAMAAAISVGMAWCFGITYLAIGHLNTASGFLVSIVFGNGINFGILLRARYNEARRSGLPLAEAALVAYEGTWRSTLTIAVAAGVGYASLAATSFRGFHDFGFIGGYGMLLCWLSTYLVMIPLLTILEPWGHVKVEPDKQGRLARLWQRGIPFGAPFARLVPIAPRFVAALALVATAYAGWSTYRYVKADPLEYELWRLENDPTEPSPAQRLGGEIDGLTGRTGPDGMALLVDRVDQVKPLTDVLNARRDAAPEGKKPFSKIVSIMDFIPDHQTEKLETIASLRHRLERLHELGKISGDDWTTASEWISADLTPFGIAELPEPVARPFTERDGTRGRIVYIAPSEHESVADVRYLRRWADSFRFVKLPTGETIIGAGRAVIVADMLEAVIAEAPRATLASILGTALVVLLASIRRRTGLGAGALVLIGLAMGLVWMGAALAYLDTKINFLNFIAIPITCGIGADYAINVVNRWRTEGKGGAVLAVRETGGAVVLCSLTTTLGYLALLRSVNAAVRSFGRAAVIGEVSCLLAALVALPAILFLFDRRRAE